MTPTIRFWRRISQVFVALVFVVIPLLNLRGMTFLSGNLLSLYTFGFTFADPLAVLQTLSGGFPAFTALLGGGSVLLIALTLGRIFCGWMCPYGLASELLHSLTAKRRAAQTTAVQASAGPSVSSRVFAGRAAVAGLGCVAALFVFHEPVLNQLSMPGWYTRALQHGIFFSAVLFGALFFPVVLVVEFVAAKRLWCRYLCPQSVLLSLAAASSLGLRVRFARKRCTCAKNDRSCLAACSLDLNPRKEALAQRLECTNCGDCVDACRERGRALGYSFRASGPEQPVK